MPDTTAPPAPEDGSKPPKPGGEGKSVDGKFLPGNNFWKARSSHGRKPIFETPEDLWSACVEYFEWVEANPLYERKVFHNGGKVVHADVPKLRAMTLSGLRIFLGIGEQTWVDYVQRADFSGVTAMAYEIIKTQKFEGAAADQFNANIIARDLGLTDKTESNETVTLAAPVKVVYEVMEPAIKPPEPPKPPARETD